MCIRDSPRCGPAVCHWPDIAHDATSSGPRGKKGLRRSPGRRGRHKEDASCFGLRSIVVGAAHVVTATLAHQLAFRLVQLLAADRAVEHRLFGGFLNGGRFGFQTPIIIKVTLCTGSCLLYTSPSPRDS